MKDLVKELAEKVRETIKQEPPEIIEMRSQLILIDMANTLHKHKAIDAYAFIEMSQEIHSLYNPK